MNHEPNEGLAVVKKVRCALKLSLLVLSILLTSMVSARAQGVLLPDFNSDPLASFGNEPEYLDMVSYDRLYGVVTQTYEVSGTRSDSQEDFTLKAVVTLNARLTAKGTSVVRSIKGSSVASTAAFDENGKPCRHVVKTTFENTKTNPDEPQWNSNLVGSKKLGLCRFVVPSLMAMDWEQLHWKTSGSGCHALGAGQGISSLGGDSGGSGGSSPIDFDNVEGPRFWSFPSIRVPNFSSGHTKFATVARKAEATGRTPFGILNDSGMIESNWNGTSTQGRLQVSLIGGETAAVRAAKLKDNVNVAPIDDDSSPEDQAFPGTLTVTWSLSAKPPEPLQLVVVPEGYDTWQPTAGKDEKTAGNMILIKATLETKSGKTPTTTTADRYTFELSGVSHEPGICINYPAPAQALKDADLQFDPKENPDGEVDGKERQTAIFTTDAAAEDAYISAYDYGAYGALKVTCETSDGQKIVGYLQGKLQTQSILLPQRSANSDIADAWKKSNDVSGADAADDNKQSGNAHNGDGFTMYEEYRGVWAKGAHQSLDPKKKNLLVENDIGTDGEGGIKLFATASGMNVVVLNEHELEANRVVNFNHGNSALHKVDQHGVVIKSAPLSNKKNAKGDKDGDTLGWAVPSDFNGKMHPKDCQEVDVDTAGMKNIWNNPQSMEVAKERNYSKADMDGTVQANMKVVIAHELGHACGLIHHGDHGLDPRMRRITISDMKDYEAYDTAGNPIIPTADHPIEITGLVGSVGGLSSGDTNCIMCYNDLYEWVLKPKTSTTPYRYYQVPAVWIGIGHIFCKSPKGTGINDAKNKPVSLFGDATIIDKDGGCMAMFDVNDSNAKK